MAKHDVKFEIPSATLGKKDVIFQIRRDGKLEVSNGAIVSHSRGGNFRMGWKDFDALMREHGASLGSRPEQDEESQNASDTLGAVRSVLNLGPRGVVISKGGHEASHPKIPVAKCLSITITVQAEELNDDGWLDAAETAAEVEGREASGR